MGLNCTHVGREKAHNEQTSRHGSEQARAESSNNGIARATTCGDRTGQSEHGRERATVKQEELSLADRLPRAHRVPSVHLVYPSMDADVQAIPAVGTRKWAA